MKRRHAPELEDWAACPPAVRDGATDVLVLVLAWIGWPQAIAQRLGPWLAEQEWPAVHDRCSGAGGPLAGLLRRLPPPFRLRLSDRFPNLSAWEQLSDQFPGRVEWDSAPLDARCPPPEPRAVWTFCNAFHHFRPRDAQRVLNEATHRGCPVALFEATDRHPLRLLLVCLVPLAAWLAGWWLFRRQPVKLLLTYVLPLIPLLLLWDGWMSCFRIYSKEELEDMKQAADPEGQWDWEVGTLRFARLPLSFRYLLGRPR